MVSCIYPSNSHVHFPHKFGSLQLSDKVGSSLLGLPGMCCVPLGPVRISLRSSSLGLPCTGETRMGFLMTVQGHRGMLYREPDSLVLKATVSLLLPDLSWL